MFKWSLPVWGLNESTKRNPGRNKSAARGDARLNIQSPLLLHPRTSAHKWKLCVRLALERWTQREREALLPVQSVQPSQTRSMSFDRRSMDVPVAWQRRLTDVAPRLKWSGTIGLLSRCLAIINKYLFFVRCPFFSEATRTASPSVSLPSSRPLLLLLLLLTQKQSNVIKLQASKFTR